MNGPSRNNNKYSTEFNGATRDLGVGVDIDVEIDTNKNEEIIGNFDSAHSNNFERDCFAEDEWMRQLQGDEQQQDFIGQGGEAGLNSLEQPQYRFSYEQNISLTPQPLDNTDSDGRGPLHGIEQTQPLQGAKRIQTQLPQQITNLQELNSLPQLEGADNIAALNNVFQQQQQHHRYSPFANNATQTISNNLGTTQTLEQQMESLQQQQREQKQRLHEQHCQQREQLAASNLKESLVQLQRLQEQQQQILNTIGHAGLVHPNGLLNLLNTLVGQINNNNSSNGENNKTPLNAATYCAEKVGQMPGMPQLRMDDNSLPNVRTMPALNHQMQPPQMDFLENKDISRHSEQQQKIRQQQIALVQRQQIANRKNRYAENKYYNQVSDNNSQSSNNSVDDALSIEPSPMMRQAEKKREPSPFPKQLWEAMMTDGPSNDDAFEWLPDGKSFVIVDPDLFCTEILDRKFKQSKYGSFVRKLHRWGFIRLTSGTGTDCFHHPLFQRTKPYLVLQIKCSNRNGKTSKAKGHNPYARGDIIHNAQPSLMGVEKFIRAKVVSPESAEDAPNEKNTFS
mmetsp:Transcript_895/g.2254  ORF Transcript_895/g.2254 Transcript_895/m.2254 type:complete len:565 (-) Transcript_895:481-2175(-)